MERLNFFKDPLLRVTLIDFSIIILLILNAVFYVNDPLQIYIQLFIILLVLIHYNYNKNLIKNELIDFTHSKLQQVIDNKNLQLQKQSKRFEFAINSSRDGFWDYDLTEKKFYLSDAWRKRLGFDDSNHTSYLDYLALIPDEYRFEHHSAMHDTIDNCSEDVEYIHFKIIYPLISKIGEKLIIEDVGDIYFDKNNNPVRMTGFHRDITDQERQNKIIESQNRLSAMGEVLSNISHQWRQPIGAINNVLNDLEFDIELDDLKELETKRFLDTSSKIKEYTEYLSKTMDDFRTLSSNEKKKANFIVKKCISDAFNIVQLEYKKHNIHFNLIEIGDLTAYIIGYERELQQVFLNLFNNSKDIFIEQGTNEATINIIINNLKNNITITIHDNAGGIPEEIISKVFNPYFTTKHENIGTGLGLYLSKKIVTEYFKGTLNVENENNGAKFTIIIPK